MLCCCRDETWTKYPSKYSGFQGTLDNKNHDHMSLTFLPPFSLQKRGLRLCLPRHVVTAAAVCSSLGDTMPGQLTWNSRVEMGEMGPRGHIKPHMFLVDFLQTFFWSLMVSPNLLILYFNWGWHWQVEDSQSDATAIYMMWVTVNQKVEFR